MRKQAAALVPVIAWAIAAAPPAAAFSIGVVELERNDAPGEDATWGLVETPDVFDDDGTKREKATALGVVAAPGAPVADAPGATASFTTRYAGIFSADADTGGGILQPWQVAYRIVFEVDACAGCAWTATIEGWHAGAVTFGNDLTTTGVGASAQVDRPRMGVDGSDAGGSSSFAPSSTTGGDVPFARVDAPVEITGVGPSQHQLDYRALLTLRSHGNGPIGLGLPGDEVSVRLGRAGTLTGVAADDYPGAGARVLADDGIFARVTVTLTAVPEPSTGALLALGLLGVRRSARAS